MLRRQAEHYRSRENHLDVDWIAKGLLSEYNVVQMPYCEKNLLKSLLICKGSVNVIGKWKVRRYGGRLLRDNIAD